MDIDNEVLKEKLKVILAEVIRVCDENGLKYFMCGGSCLGAVRHKDIIPWDDDIDIFLLRPDYEKFRKIANEKLKKPYAMCDCHNTPGYVWPFMKVFDFSTTLIQQKNPFFAGGLFVDVFPLDGVPNNGFVDKVHFKFHNFLKYISMPVASSRLESGSISLKIAAVVKKFFSPVRVCIYDFREWFLKHRSIADKRCVRSYHSQWGLRHTALRKDFDDAVLMPFGNLKVRIPVGYVDYLTRLYKDYMKLPPIEKRVSHHNVVYVDMERRLSDAEIEKIRIDVGGKRA